MKKRFLALLMMFVMIVPVLAGCDGPGDIAEPDPPGTIVDPGPQFMGEYGHDGDASGGTGTPDAPGWTPDRDGLELSGSDVNHNWFEDNLQQYLNDSETLAGKSYMASPASFRAALCLAIEGANGDTKTGLMKAAGFESDDSIKNWYGWLLSEQAEFYEARDILEANIAAWGDPDSDSNIDMAFDIANAIWDNASFDGSFRDEYIEVIQDKYNASFGMSNADMITADVNDWCSEKTHGMIQSISPDLSGVSSVLANALYIKAGWHDDFDSDLTASDNFTCLDGSVKQLDFMHQVEKFLYHKDESGREYALFGLQGDLWLTVALDPDARVQDMLAAMYKSNLVKLDVKMPKLDLETGLNARELVNYLADNGAGAAFDDGADFTAMTDSELGWMIDDIIQKTRLKTDEDGLEAAAVTAIMMADMAMIEEPETPVEFYMDKPFSFMITSGRNTSDSQALVLFFGRYVG